MDELAVGGGEIFGFGRGTHGRAVGFRGRGAVHVEAADVESIELQGDGDFFEDVFDVDDALGAAETAESKPDEPATTPAEPVAAAPAEPAAAGTPESKPDDPAAAPPQAAVAPPEDPRPPT